MKTLHILAAGILLFLFGMTAPGSIAQETPKDRDMRSYEDYDGWGRHIGRGWGCDGCGPGRMPGHMGPYWDGGPGMMYDRGRRMHRGPMMRHYRDDFYNRPAWEEMSEDQKKKFREMWSQYRQDTLELRKELYGRQLELETLWNRPGDVDESRIKKLIDEVARLKAELDKKHSMHLMKCREIFGDMGWSCPGL